MVRLVFRPYVHIMPSSCTSEWLRSSRTLSHPFNQYKHSSPSFGSDHHIQSLSLNNVIILSLVRVSRRVGKLPHSLNPFSFLIINLFTLQSLYLFAIGHHHIFSLGCTYHPHSGCTTKQPYSSQKKTTLTGLSPPKKTDSNPSSASSS